MTDSSNAMGIPRPVLADLARHREWRAGLAWRYDLTDGRRLLVALAGDQEFAGKMQLDVPGLGRCALTPVGQVTAGKRTLAVFSLVADKADNKKED